MARIRPISPALLKEFQLGTPPTATDTPGTLKKRWMREQIISLRRENADLQRRIREWDKVRSKFRELYMECADILDLPALRDYEDDEDEADLRWIGL